MIQRLRPEDADLVSAPLLLQCLGTLRLRDSAGKDITPRTRKSRAVLAVLALGGRASSRARLADLLWSDRGEEQAKSSVRQALFELRHLDTAGALLGSGREEIALDGDRITTDLALIADAARRDAGDELVELLEAANGELLTDLDGLDSEFDAWLRGERAHEPSRTLGAALGSARRLLEAKGPRAAQAITSQVQRLDPTSEEAARLAMRIDHALGDRAALHRHFDLFQRRLRDDYDTAPSTETLELFRELSGGPEPGPGKPVPTPGPAPIEPGDAASPAAVAEEQAPARPRLFAALIAAFALALLVLAGVAVWKMRSPPAAVEAPLLAVLPFEQLPRGDGSLAEGLWDDTRSLLSQNGTVRVLGRTTSQAMAGDNLAPKAYRDRLGVDYILDGSVQRQGDRVRVTVSHTRTADGIGIWEHVFNGRLGDPLALQGAIAQSIEGRIRGRLARGGGALAEQIATNPEVYSLYSEARTRLRGRRLDDIDAATGLLRQAIGRDPNFAPAHASLAIALSIGRPKPTDTSNRQVEAIAEARRAIALAPNLSQAHASLAIAEGMGSAMSEQALKRAVALDPGNAEAWTWLGNALHQKFRPVEAVQAYWKAVEIDPLWMPAATNLGENLANAGDYGAVERLAGRIDRTGGDPELASYIRSMGSIIGGDYSAGVGRLLAYRRSNPYRSTGVTKDGLFDGLVRLGYYPEAKKLWDGNDWFAPVLRGEAMPPDVIDGVKVGPRDYWLASYYPSYASRAAIKLGHARDLADKYRRGFRSSDDFVATLTANGSLQKVTPNLAVALIKTGDKAEAGRLLAAADRWASRGLARSGNDRDLMVELARIRAVEQRDKEAIDLIGAAVGHGWLPDGLEDALDLADEPTFRNLRGDPRFKALRARILAHIARERKELGPVKL
jgi:DNA-binding SARP family transcriptional activator/TolB-like protein